MAWSDILTLESVMVYEAWQVGLQHDTFLTVSPGEHGFTVNVRARTINDTLVGSLRLNCTRNAQQFFKIDSNFDPQGDDNAPGALDFSSYVPEPGTTITSSYTIEEEEYEPSAYNEFEPEPEDSAYYGGDYLNGEPPYHEIDYESKNSSVVTAMQKTFEAYTPHTLSSVYSSQSGSFDWDEFYRTNRPDRSTPRTFPPDSRFPESSNSEKPEYPNRWPFTAWATYSEDYTSIPTVDTEYSSCSTSDCPVMMDSDFPKEPDVCGKSCVTTGDCEGTCIRCVEIHDPLLRRTSPRRCHG